MLKSWLQALWKLGVALFCLVIEVLWVLLEQKYRPGPIRIISVKEYLGMSKFGYTFALPEIPAELQKEVVSRHFTATENGATVLDVTLAVDEAPPEVVVAEDAEVVVSLRDIDNAGNPSEPSELSFVAEDTVPPPKPGELGIVATREIYDDVDEEEEPVDEEQVDGEDGD